jgi:3',5'-cyclic AMP phosphodiesterase CpdA
MLRLILPLGWLILFLHACRLPGDFEKTEEYIAARDDQKTTTVLSSSPTHAPGIEPTITPAPPPEVLVGAGDISICGQKGDDLTAALLADIRGTIFTVGDNSNENGTSYEYLNCFGPSWGRFLGRLYPSPGNHDYVTENASAYYDYFASVPVERGKGYYSYDIGSWHIIALNSVINTGMDSNQIQWLREDLASHPTLCSLAYWHHPRWTSGESGNNGRMATIWETLYEYGVDVVVNGNEHMYERFAPMDPNGELDRVKGIRQFVAGTGGVSHYNFGVMHPNSEVRDNTAFGVLKFNLYAYSYDWEFIPVMGMSFNDSGSDLCHR